MDNHVAKHNFHSITNEYKFYRSCLLVQGSVIPHVGLRTSSYQTTSIITLVEEGEDPITQQINCLFIERMDCVLFSNVCNKGIEKIVNCIDHESKTLLIGHFMFEILRMIKAIHGQGHLVVDVKPENIMFGFLALDDPKAALYVDNDIGSQAGLLRMVNFGQAVNLPKNIYGDESYTMNVDCVEARSGSPIYRSRFADDAGHHLTRRDDLEAVGLVIAHLIIRIKAALANTSEESDWPELPWSTEGSDEALKLKKCTEMGDRNSDFYKQLDESADTMLEFFAKTAAMKDDKKPDYGDLALLLWPMTLKVPVSASANATRSARPEAVKAEHPFVIEALGHAFYVDLMEPAPAQIQVVKEIPDYVVKCIRVMRGGACASATVGTSWNVFPSSGKVKIGHGVYNDIQLDTDRSVSGVSSLHGLLYVNDERVVCYADLGSEYGTWKYSGPGEGEDSDNAGNPNR
ncbi:hypothetical protein MPSEU_000630000 [Mayamaea pseudoterrestris]|nr:hypothetical protein MPSEU_000630000 [Mayamaea pseudoterrestris]